MGRGARAASPGPLEGTGRNRTLFSSEERKGGQDSSKTRNGKKEMNPAPNLSNFLFHLCYSVSHRTYYKSGFLGKRL